MKKILFVCHGNICRSPMAEAIFKDMVKKRGRDGGLCIASRATSAEELGNPIYPPARAELERRGVPVPRTRATRLTRGDYDSSDLLVCMDMSNVRAAARMLGGDERGKIKLLMDYTGRGGEVADPWFTRRFDIACEDILEGCEGLYNTLFGVIDNGDA